MKEKKCGCIRYEDYIAAIKYSDYIKEGLENSIKYADYCNDRYPLEVIENKIKEVLKKSNLDTKEQLLIEAHNKRIAINRKRQMDSVLDDVQYVECDIRELEEIKNWQNYSYAEYFCENKTISYAEYISEQIN